LPEARATEEGEPESEQWGSLGNVVYRHICHNAWFGLKAVIPQELKGYPLPKFPVNPDEIGTDILEQGLKGISGKTEVLNIPLFGFKEVKSEWTRGGIKVALGQPAVRMIGPGYSIIKGSNNMPLKSMI
jgi:hypothetical protein